MIARIRQKHVFRVALGLAAFALAGFAGWLATLPPTPPARSPPPVNARETREILAALAPRSHRRPVIAVVGLNNATETTDYLMSTGILRRADVADVLMLATDSGPVTLYPALRALPDATIAQFDARHPAGADYVIVPAMRRDDDPHVLRWIRSQAAKGAIVVSVCAGARVAANAGLLDGRRATTHWYYLRDMLERHPEIRYVPDRRMVVDRGVGTTTGITASMPAMLTLVEAIGGRAKALSVARELGVAHWDTRHASDMFAFTRPFATTVLGNSIAFWRHETLGIPLRPGIDEVSLALVSDAWSRTYRSRALTFAASAEAVVSRHGIRILPDRVASRWPEAQRVPGFAAQRPADALERTLDGMAVRYGPRTVYVVAMQLEYPRVAR